MLKKIKMVLGVGLLALSASANSSIVFESCGIYSIESEFKAYLKSLGMNEDWFTLTPTVTGLNVSLKSSGNSLYLKFNPAYKISSDEVIQRGVLIETVSKKEIILAMAHPDRPLLFKGAYCSVPVLNEHVELRQNVVSWAQKLEWRWPDGTPAVWNKKYWNKGDLVGSNLPRAVNDMFESQSKYAIGCYTATKMVYAQAFLDYFGVKRPDAAKLQAVTSMLMVDGDPLVGIDPPAMWHFEDGKSIHELPQEGKLLSIEPTVSSNSFIPGDWVYFLNTDPVSRERTGYEGSNAIYLGGNKFDDYYNDNQHSYTYQEKIDEVYQWRNGVFSRSRHYNKLVPLTASDKLAMDKSPEEGGLLMPYRVSPMMLPFYELRN